MIKEAKVTDAAGIAVTHVNSWRSSYCEILPSHYLAGLSVSQRQTSWEKSLVHPGEKTFIVEYGARVSGFATFGECRDSDKNPKLSCELRAIYLDQDMQGRGHGARLFLQGINWARERGFSELTTMVLEKNEAARRFYEKMGMSPDGHKVTISIGGREVIELRYCAPLKQLSCSRILSASAP